MKLVVLGWFAETHHRIRFVKHLRTALACRLGEAKRLMESTLEAENLPVEIRGVTHPYALGRELAACGAEVRVVTAAQLSDIEAKLAEVSWDLPRAELEQVIGAIAPDLCPTETPD